MDSIKDHVIHHITGKSHAFEIWKALCTIYQSKNQNRKMVLREKLRNTKMTNANIITTYLTKISQIEMNWVLLVRKWKMKSLLDMLLMGSLQNGTHLCKE